MQGLSLSLCWQILRITIRNNAVHIPLYISNICTCEEIAHRCNHVVHNFGICKIEHSLISAFCMILTRNVHRPVWMFFIKIALHINHLRLNPDSKRKSKIIDLFAQSTHTVRKFFWIDIPVSKGCLIIISLSKPAVINHKQFDADISCGFGKL